MINGIDNPVEWALVFYELEEVIEHLQTLSNQIIPQESIDEKDFETHMRHIYAHLNLIWNSRHHIGEISNETRNQLSQFPTDINPL